MNEAKLWFWILLDAFLVALVLAWVTLVMPTMIRFNNSLTPSRTVTVSAEGKTTGSPDLAEVSFSVVTQGQNPTDLSNNNNDKMSAVLQFVSAQGIASSDIATTAYDLQPNYRYDKNLQRNFITGYTLTQTVMVKIRDLNKVATVLGGLAPLGVNQVSGVSYTFADPDNLVSVARADALSKARAKAWDMANGAGVALGEVVNISESPYFPGPKYYAADAAMGLGGAPAPSLPPVQPGSQDVTDNVTITYALIR